MPQRRTLENSLCGRRQQEQDVRHVLETARRPVTARVRQGGGVGAGAQEARWQGRVGGLVHEVMRGLWFL